MPKIKKHGAESEEQKELQVTSSWPDYEGQSKQLY